jgi:IQ and AAA domain-containing protein
LQGFMDWGAIYVKYLQTFRNLEQVYDQMVHPQKRIHVKEALEICAGRMLEVRSWLVWPWLVPEFS